MIDTYGVPIFPIFCKTAEASGQNLLIILMDSCREEAPIRLAGLASPLRAFIHRPGGHRP